MGQFSWIYSDSGKPMVDRLFKKSFLLVPEQFRNNVGADYITEPCYNGYGIMGSYDVYDLAATWNKEYIPEMLRLSDRGEWRFFITSSDRQNLENYYNNLPISCELRALGNCMACYDEDNERLPFPIKITESVMDYEDANPSKADPLQGWYDFDNEKDLLELWEIFCETPTRVAEGRTVIAEYSIIWDEGTDVDEIMKWFEKISNHAETIHKNTTQRRKSI